MLLNDVVGVCAHFGNREMKIVQPRATRAVHRVVDVEVPAVSISETAGTSKVR
jgi:hypothetical protein